MTAPHLTRRSFFHVAGASGAALIAVGCLPIGNPGQPGGPTGGAQVFKRSGRGRKISNAAKSHNANHLYTTAQAAANDPAHPGDHSKVVSLTISQDLFNSLFSAGNTSADLRHAL